MSLRFSINSEANASELIENLKEMFSCCFVENTLESDIRVTKKGVDGIRHQNSISHFQWVNLGFRSYNN